jgi:lipopolysaccharide/colanic/teichoic acid biosynthesis glycosyltransferase
MAFLPSSKSMIGYKVSGSDLLAAPVSAALAFLIKPFDGRHVVGLTDMILYTSLSAGFAGLFFIVFRIAQGLPSYFSVPDALRIAKATLCIIVSTTVVAIVVLRIDPLPLSVPVIQFLLLIVMLSIARVAQGLLAHRRTLTGMERVSADSQGHVLIVGAGPLAFFYVRLLDANSDGGSRIAGILDDDPRLHGRSILGYVIMGGVREASLLLDDFAQHGVLVTRVAVCEGDRNRAASYRERLESMCAARGLQLELLVESSGLFSRPSVAPNSPVSPVRLANASYFRIKRLIETVIAIVSVALLAPLFVLAAVLALTSVGWPVIFWQRRIGRGGRSFLIYKFKTMLNPVNRDGRTLPIDGRQTRMGDFLRATRLDELPQLFNIIVGDMAIIGPRPLLPRDQPTESSLRLAVAPGLTGWAQINGGKLISTEEKCALDEWYVQNASLRLDAEIAWRTLLTVLRGDRRDDVQLAEALARAGKRLAGRPNGQTLELHRGSNI